MARTTRRDRVAFRPGAEWLEGKMLQSGAGRGSALMAGPNRLVAGNAGRRVEYTARFDQSHVSREDGVVNLVVTRSASDAGRSRTFRLRTSATYDQVVTGPATPKSLALPFGRRTLGAYSGGQSPDANGRHTVSWDMKTTGRDLTALPIAPVSGTYRFAPGQTSLTIPVRLNPSFVLPETGSITLRANVDMPGGISAPAGDLMWGWVTIKPGRVQVPAEIVASSLSEQAIALAFNRDVDRAVAENLGHYMVAAQLGYDNTGLPIWKKVALQSASYDPASRTLTLTPTAAIGRDQGGYQLFSPSNLTENGFYGGSWARIPYLQPDGRLVGSVPLVWGNAGSPTEGPGGPRPAPELAPPPASIPVQRRG